MFVPDRPEHLPGKLAPRGHSIHLTAGDHTLPGPFYTASADVPWLKANGPADIQFYNTRIEIGEDAQEVSTVAGKVVRSA